MTQEDIRRLADLHTQSLPDSMVSVLGSKYAQSFYRFVCRSPNEFLEVERDAGGKIISAAVLSLEPKTLSRRLLCGTSLMPHLLTQGPGLLLRRFIARRPTQRSLAQASLHDVLDMPELILIYSSDEARGQGIGARLIARLEARLREQGVKRYQVKTVADSSNRALAFYAREGFTPAGILSQRGEFFQVFTKTL